VLVLEDTFPSDGREFMSEQARDPMLIFHKVRDEWLVEGIGSPFNHLHKLLNYGMKIGKETKTRTRLRWSRSGKTLYFGQRALEIAKWKQFVSKLLDKGEDMLSKLIFQGDGSIPGMDLNSIIDDPDKRHAGHYFALDEEGAYKKARLRMLERLGKSDKWDKMMENLGDELKFLNAGVDEYLSLDEEFRVLLCIAMIFTCGLSGRGREMTSLLYMNTMEADRNILCEDGQMMLISEYHKSMAMMEDLKVKD